MTRSAAVLGLACALVFAARDASAQGQPGLPRPGVTCGCSDCDPGECMVSVEKWVAEGDYVYVPNPPCGNDVAREKQQMGRFIAEAAVPGISDAAGPLVDQVWSYVTNQAGSHARGAIGEILSRWTQPAGQCHVLCALIPRSSTRTAQKLLCGDGGYGVSGCKVDGNGEYPCGCGWAKFFDFSETREGAARMVCSTFMNWSHDRARWASMSIYFKP